MTTSPQTDSVQHGAVEPVDDKHNENLIPQLLFGPMTVHVPEDYVDPTPAPVDGATLPQLVRVECGAEPPHDPMWMEYDDEAWYPPGCPRCWYEAMRDAHAGCQHSHHRAWRRWKLSKWLAGWAYRLGLIAAYTFSYDAHCHGCMDGFRLKSKTGRPYILGWPTWKWGCLLKNRHWPGRYVGFGCCTKCLPCPECGSTEWEHDALHQQDVVAPETADSGGGRHRLSPQHPGWETAPEDMAALLRANAGE